MGPAEPRSRPGVRPSVELYPTTCLKQNCALVARAHAMEDSFQNRLLIMRVNEQLLIVLTNFYPEHQQGERVCAQVARVW
jgi:hypothetical protein